MYVVFLIIYLLVAISLIFLIMLQHEKGIDISGHSLNTRNLLEGVSSTNSGGNFITRLTATLGVLFFFLSLLLGNISNKHSQRLYEKNHVHSKQESCDGRGSAGSTTVGVVNNLEK